METWFRQLFLIKTRVEALKDSSGDLSNARQEVATLTGIQLAYGRLRATIPFNAGTGPYLRMSEYLEDRLTEIKEWKEQISLIILEFGL